MDKYALCAEKYTEMLAVMYSIVVYKYADICDINSKAEKNALFYLCNCLVKSRYMSLIVDVHIY